MVDTGFTMSTFSKFQKEVIDIFNENNWLGADISKVVCGYSKMFIDSCCLVQVNSQPSSK